MLPSPQTEHEANSAKPAPSSAAVREQLRRILAHSLFTNSKRYPVFLAYTVEETLLGHANELKERTIGVQAFGREPSYDVNLDPVVRTTAAEVRKRLIQYYYNTDHTGELVIELPVGSYVPIFRDTVIVKAGLLPEAVTPENSEIPSSGSVRYTFQNQAFCYQPERFAMHSFRRLALLTCTALFLAWPVMGQVSGATDLHIDANAPTTTFPHFWEKTFGSGRAILSLREGYRKDIKTVKEATGFESVRFHGILMDEVGLYNPDRVLKNPGLAAEAINDASAYNFMYVDQIYDGLLKEGIKPFVELSFMPRKMAADPNNLHPFFYHPVVSPPRDYKLWDDMIRAFAAHLIARYGIDEVSTWKFEVWNEPNLDFWGGTPKQSTYWTLYDHTARAMKSVSQRLQVGGPATAQAAWVPDFLTHVSENHIPVDFVSTHVYGNDSAPNVLGTSEDVPRAQMVYRAVKKVHDQIASSPLPHIPLIFSEYGASYSNEPNVTDSPYMGPWLANTIRQCDGLVDNLAYWTFSDVFEEQGVAYSAFYGGFGLIAPDNIPKASFNAFAALHRLGDRRIAVDSDSALATKLQDGGLAIALWNYAPPGGSGPSYTLQSTLPGAARTFDLHLEHSGGMQAVTLYRVDSTHGNSLALFDQMGRPANLTKDQISKLQSAGSMPPPEHLKLKDGRISISVPTYGLAVLVVQKR